MNLFARLFAVCENRTFDRMLSNPTSKLDLFSEMNAGKVILINTAKDLLKQQGTEIFGRFFLALIAQAAQERATLDPSDRLPCYVYIDECQDYLSTDSNFTTILEQARKQNIGMIVAHQYLGQLSQHTLDSLYANTSIKCAGGLSDKDAQALARNMQCQPSFLTEQPRGSFATYIRNTTKRAIGLNFPLTPIHRWPAMSEPDRLSLLDQLRAAYAIHQPHVSVPVVSSVNAGPPADPPLRQPEPMPAPTSVQSGPLVDIDKPAKWPL